MSADTPKAIPRRHLIRALLGREVPATAAPQAQTPAGEPHAAGDAAYALGDYPAAVAAYRATVHGDLSNVAMRARLGYALYATGQFVQARVEFEHVLRLTDGTDAFARLCLGLTLAALGKTEKAAAILETFDAPDTPDLTALCRRITERLREPGLADAAPLRLTLERSARAMAFLPQA
jgi:tetratricopeptide (TPR) repeat protein